MTENKLSHIDKDGQPSMVDVTHKVVSQRLAEAQGKITISAEHMSTMAASGFSTKKGSITQTAIIAATMAVKNTFNTIPLCHQIPITSCKIFIDPQDDGFDIRCRVKTNGQTGVEMEALHGVSVAALTIYDMCKALSHDMMIGQIVLTQKKGGKNDFEK